MLEKSGKTRFVGVTGKNARFIERILSHIDVDSVMIAHQFNPIYRNANEYLLPLTERRNIGLVIGAPFMKGWLAVPQTEWKDNAPEWMDDTFRHAYFQYLDIVHHSGLDLADVTIRWMLSEKRQHSIVAGFTKIDEIQFNIRAVKQGDLPIELIEAINKIGIIHPLIYQNRTTV